MSENECLCVLQAKSLMNKILTNNHQNNNETSSFRNMPKIINKSGTNNNNATVTSDNKTKLTATNLNLSQNSLNSTIKLTQSISSVDTVTIQNIDLKNEDEDDDVDEGDEGDDEFDENESYHETDRVQGR